MDILKNTTSLSLLLASYYFAFLTFDEIDIKDNVFFYRVIQSSVVLNLLSLASIIRTYRSQNRNIVSSITWITSTTFFFSFVTAGAYGPHFNVNDDQIFKGILEFYNAAINIGLHLYLGHETRKNVMSMYDIFSISS